MKKPSTPINLRPPAHVEGLRVRANADAQTCLYCRDDLRDLARSCKDCGAAYHVSCWTTLRGCETLGCKGTHTRLAGRPAVRGGARLRRAMSPRRGSLRSIVLGFLVLGAMGFIVGQFVAGGELKGGPILWQAWLGFLLVGSCGAAFGAGEAE